MSDQPVVEKAPRIFRVFKSHIRSTQFIFGNQPDYDPIRNPTRSAVNGKIAAFVDGKYRTDNAFEIAQLEHEVAAGHPTIYIDPNESTIEIDSEDPIAALKAQWLAESEERIRAEIMASINPKNDAGDYEPPKVLPQNTSVQDAMGLTDAAKAVSMADALKNLNK